MNRQKREITVTAPRFNAYAMYIDLIGAKHRLSISALSVAAFLAERYVEVLEKGVDNVDIINTIVMSKETKAEIRTALSMSHQNYNNVLITLRQAEIIVDGKFNEAYLPHDELVFKFKTK